MLLNLKSDDNNIKPGRRPDNDFLQYREFKNEQELKEYWQKPFIVKPYLGFYHWSAPQTKCRTTNKNYAIGSRFPEIDKVFKTKFGDSNYVSNFIRLNAIEHKKGEDTFNMDKALFYSMIFEIYGDLFLPEFSRHVVNLSQSVEESDQRSAAEMIYGIVRGSRFWPFEPSRALWIDLLNPVIKSLCTTHITQESIADWEICFSALSNKIDPNRLYWFYEQLLELLQNGSLTTFSNSVILRLCNKTLMQNWKVEKLFVRTNEILKKHLSRPYHKIRTHISKMYATLMTMDVEYLDLNGWNSGGRQFPKINNFIAEIIPKLNLNSHNPEIANNMEVDNNADENSMYLLETVSCWLLYYIQICSSAMNPSIYQLLPYLCQFIGVESDQEVSQSCLNALCLLSVSMINDESSLKVLLNIIHKVIKSDSYKAKISVLEYVQVFVFTNFMFLFKNKDVVEEIEDLIVKHMSDDHLQVRNKAAKILCGLLHSSFLEPDKTHSRLIARFRGLIRTKMTRKDKKKIKFSKIDNIKERLAEFHCGILGNYFL